MQQSYRQPMDKQAHCETMEVMAGSRNADIVARDKESETNDSAEKESSRIQFSLDHYSNQTTMQ